MLMDSQEPQHSHAYTAEAEDDNGSFIVTFEYDGTQKKPRRFGVYNR